MAIQPVALCSLLTALARWVLRIEILILWALTAIQISQQEYAWVSKRFNDLSPHDSILHSGIAADADWRGGRQKGKPVRPGRPWILSGESQLIL
jgi:hypothetical protein